MKMTRQAAVILTACGLITMMGIGGTVAYLTDRTEATNSFTFGDVKVNTVEPDWDTTDTDGDGVPDMAEDVVPNQQVPKSVQAENVGNNDAVVFVKVTVPLENVTHVADDGTADRLGDGTLDRRLQEVFYFQGKDDGIHTGNNHFNGGWINVPEAETGYEGAGGSEEYLDLSAGRAYSGDVRTYVFGYHERLKRGEATGKLFDQVQIKNVIENEVTPGATKNIKIETYSIQADNIVGADGAIDTGGELDHGRLWEIYRIYVTQNPVNG